MEEEPKRVLKKAKFSKEEAIVSFKEKMGLGLSSIKQQLMMRNQSGK
jgi:hypothetical protein